LGGAGFRLRPPRDGPRKGSADDFDVVDGSGRIVAASSSQAVARGMTCTPQGGLSLPSLKS